MKTKYPKQPLPATGATLLRGAFRVKGSLTCYSSEPKTVRAAIALLDKHPDDELLTTRDLAGLLGIQKDTLQQDCLHPSLAPYRSPAPGSLRTLYGNRDTIAAYRAEANSTAEWRALQKTK